MTLTGAQSLAKQYSQIGTATQAEAASPHQLILMLLNGAIEKLALAKGHLSRGDIGQKGKQIFWAISIVAGLRTCLDLEKGGEVAENLERLYDYMERRLVQVNANNDMQGIDEVMSLLNEIREGWMGIPAEYR